MSKTDTQQDDKKTEGRRTLHLKKPAEGGAGRPGMGGRGPKAVVVERKRKRVVLKKDGGAARVEATPPKPTFDASVLKPRKAKVAAEKPSSESTRPDKGLTEEEREARLRALEGAKAVEEQMKREEDEIARRFAEDKARREAEERAAQEARRRREEEARRKAEEEARRAEEEEKLKAEEEARRKAEEEERKAADQAKRKVEAPAKPLARHLDESDDDFRKRRAAAKTPGRKGEPRRRQHKLTVNTAMLTEEEETRQRSLAALRRKREKRRKREEHQPPEKVVREVVVPETITVQELSNRMATRSSDVIKALMKMGVMATINEALDADTAELVVEEFGHKVKRVSEADVEIGIGGEPDDEKDLRPRPPVVTVMGHVDHGKTSLLDALRETDVVASEAGGITQHIGAYQVTLAGGEKITFLDTPGHEAFTAMRSRGAQVTDIVVLVVAADDSIMPQTVEAINHARAAEVPIIVAINKIDKPGANPDRVRQDLLQHEVIVESLGGDVLDVEVSALKKTNLDKLEEAILLQAELLDLKANPDRPAEGVVIEAELDKGRGPVATVLVQRGTLKVGDVFVAGSEWGRVRALLDERNRQVKSAGPAQPVVVLGLNGTPAAGDDFAVVDNEARAREISDFRMRQKEKARQAAGRPASLEAMFDKLKSQQATLFPVLVKGDVQGSVEAIISALDKLSTEEVEAKVIHSAVGGITESDVSLAAASEAPILAFNVRANKQAREAAARDGVEIRYYSVIYDLVDDVKAAMSGLLAPEKRENTLGLAEVLQVFSAGKAGKAAGCLVTEGVVRAGAKARLLRDDVVVYDGELGSLRRFKDEVKEVKAGTECGMAFANYNDMKVGDLIEVYEIEEVQRAL
ncbi:MAG: translation initiation factor IF-2 [Alphaproteobacteria bacterium]|nr:MAG: translation initiation factor IF-2 [Alphaproteobacteria bacterium]